MLRTLCGAFVAFLLAVSPLRATEVGDDKGWKKLQVIEYSLLNPPAEEEVKSIEDLLRERLDRAKSLITTTPKSELVRIEANYIRTTGAGEIVLHESSFHLEPRYSSFSPEGRETISEKNTVPQPVMYFLGYARTPLALPMVSNLSEALRGDEAAYTVQLGILPLPKAAGDRSDSVTLYVIIQRSIESNRSESIVNIERYAKEFTIREGEPVQLKLENAPPERNAYIIQLEDNSILHFYEDFARYFTEHIWINTERLKFGLGKAQISPVTSRLSIPFTVAQASNVQVELLSVIDSNAPLRIIDTMRVPADYLAEADMRPMANGPYKYRFTARDLYSDKVIYSETLNFVKSAPIMVPSPQSLASADTLQVGGKREDLRKLLSDVQYRLALRDAETERLDNTLQNRTAELKRLEDELNAQREASIAGLRTRGGLGHGIAAGTNLFVGVESKEPKLAFDLSFGLLSNAPPFISTLGAENLSKRIDNPKSLGLQLTYIFMKPAGDWLQPLVGVGYYGVWSSNPKPGGTRSATILTPSIGFNNEFGGENGKWGMTATVGANIGLGVDKTMLGDFGLKFYKRF